jgi:hypothetical protein
MFLQVPECVLLKIRFVFTEIPFGSTTLPVFKLTASYTGEFRTARESFGAKKLGADIC